MQLVTEAISEACKELVRNLGRKGPLERLSNGWRKGIKLKNLNK
jgi:hypothetical protein